MIYGGVLVENPFYITNDKFITYFLNESSKALLSNFLENNVNSGIDFNVVILKGENELVNNITFSSVIDYREPSIPAGEEDNWYLLLSNDPSHFQLRSSGMVVFKDTTGQADTTWKLLFTDFTEEQCEGFNVPYTTLDI